MLGIVPQPNLHSLRLSHAPLPPCFVAMHGLRPNILGLLSHAIKSIAGYAVRASVSFNS